MPVQYTPPYSSYFSDKDLIEFSNSSVKNAVKGTAGIAEDSGSLSEFIVTMIIYILFQGEYIIILKITGSKKAAGGIHSSHGSVVFVAAVSAGGEVIKRKKKSKNGNVRNATILKEVNPLS